jgi:hypothetical protein
MSSNYGNISPTAKLIAYARRFTDIPYAKEVADASGADAAVDLLFRESNVPLDSLKNIAPMAEIRYKSMLTAIYQARRR